MTDLRVRMDEDLSGLSQMPVWLQSLSQPETMRRSIEAAIPEFRSGSLELIDLERDRLRIKKDSWTALYSLTVAGSDGERRRVQVRAWVHPGGMVDTKASSPEPFGSPGWEFGLPDYRVVLRTEPPDEGLPALPTLLNPERAAALLESAIRQCSPRYADIRIESSEPRVARYHPGSRCTIIYRPRYGPDSDGRDWPDLMVAKTYRGDKGQVAWQGMKALWESPLGTSDVVHIAEPLAFLPELNVLVQGPVREERTISDLLEEALINASFALVEELRSALREAARGLAELHTCGVDVGETVTWDDELAEVRDVIARLATWIPEVRGAGAVTLSRLETLASRQNAQPTGPAHRSFRPAQVLLYQGNISFIDFDGFCQCEPAIDLALFRATMRNLAVRLAYKGASDTQASQELLERMSTRLDSLCEDFISEYERFAPISRDRVALWEAVDLLTNVVHNWTKVRPERIDGTLYLLRRHLKRDVRDWNA